MLMMLLIMMNMMLMVHGETMWKRNINYKETILVVPVCVQECTGISLVFSQ